MKRHQDEIIVIFIYLLGIVWLILNRFYHFDILLCPTKRLLGIPCPGCGMTRSANLLVCGDIWGALVMNPNIIIVVLLVIMAPILFSYQLFFKKDIIGNINHRLNTPLFLVPFILFEIVVWAYNIYRGI